MSNRRRPPIVLAATLMLGACAGAASQDMPSLARRPIETPRPDPLPVPPGPAEPALIERIAALVNEAKVGDAAFDTALSAARPRIARAAGAAEGSEAWIDAQQAIAAVEVSRGQSVGAMAEIDTLLGERLNAMAGREATGGATEIAAAQAEIVAIVDAQATRLEALKTPLRR